MGIKKQKIVLAFLLLFVICLFMTLTYSAIYWIPGIVQEYFGEPASNIQGSKKVLLSIRLFQKRKKLTEVIDGQFDAKTFVIKSGQSANNVAENLQDQGLIPDADTLVNYWVYKGHDRSVQAGVFNIMPNETPVMIAEKLVNTSPDKISFAFLAGWRKEEVDFLLKSTGIIADIGGFAAVEQSVITECFPEDLQGISGVEGFLFPGEYDIPRNSTSLDIYCQFVNKFFASIPSDFEEQITKNNLSLYDAIILASIIQKEVVDYQEAPIIAGVLINRLMAEMPLQSDPTVQYAIGWVNESQGWWKNPLTLVDLEIDSLFNTYIYAGLPPAPISNPDLNSLLAVAMSDTTNYLYFRAACDESGRHVFSETYEEHLNAACDKKQ